MVSFENLKSEELMILSKLSNVYDYQNMYWQQLRSKFATPLARKPSPRSAPRSICKKSIPASRPKTHTFDEYIQKTIVGTFSYNHTLVIQMYQ